MDFLVHMRQKWAIWSYSKDVLKRRNVARSVELRLSGIRNPDTRMSAFGHAQMIVKISAQANLFYHP